MRHVGLALLASTAMALAGCRPAPDGAALAQVPTRGSDGSPPTSSDVEAVSPAVLARHVAPHAVPVRLRRLWAGDDPHFHAASPSPDGRYVTEVDFSDGNLAVIDLVTGRLHHLTDKKSWLESDSYAGASIFSPDGRKVVYAWYEGETGNYEIRVIDFVVADGGVPRGSGARMVHPGRNLVLYPYGWLSDDEVLTGITRFDQTTALGSLSLSTGEVQVLKSFDWRDARAVVSPDRRFIAYDLPEAPDDDARDIHLISVDGREERVLVEGAGDDAVLGWVPADGALLFYSDRSGSPSIWKLPVTDGKPAGPARLIREDVRGVVPLGFAGDAFYYGVEVEKQTYRALTIDFENRRLVRLPVEFEVPPGGQALAWSPDGEYVVHVGDGGSRISLLTARGTLLREWTFDLGIQLWLVEWMPDGSGVLLPGRDARGRQGFMRVNLDSGTLEMVRRFDPLDETTRSFSVSPDGRSLYFVRIRTHEGELDPAELVAHDLETGAERVLRHLPESRIMLSPDAASIAYTGRYRDSLWVGPVDRGDARLIVGAVGRREGFQIVGWTADSRSLLFIRTDAERTGYGGPIPTLWRAFADGREAERIAYLPDYAGGQTLHPDGRTIAYRTGVLRGEIWALDGLTPAAAVGTVGKERSR